MAFNGNEGEMMNPDQAKTWINNYQKADPKAVKAEFFGFKKLSELLGQTNAIGIRIYYAKDDAGVSRLVIVAVTPDEKNIAPIDGTAQGMVLENGYPCPPYCPPM
jgi:hypothetical protein